MRFTQSTSTGGLGIELAARNKSTIQTECESILLEDIFKTRLWVYSFLSQCFYQAPSEQTLNPVTAIIIFRTLSEMGSEPVNKWASSLTEAIENLASGEKKSWDEVRQEYQRLFIGPGPLPAAPWESVYLSEDHITLDEHTLAVREFYRRWGYEVSNVKQDPDDHIGLELEFMALLINTSLGNIHPDKQQKLIEILDAQRTFLNNHLFCWVKPFCSKLAENTKHPLFSGIALFTPEYLRMDADLLEEIITLLKSDGLRN